jgi:hypothetical protein
MSEGRAREGGVKRINVGCSHDDEIRNRVQAAEQDRGRNPSVR